MELVISKSVMAAKSSISVDSLRCYSVVLETAAAEYKGMNAKGDAVRPKICIKYNKHGCSSVSSTIDCRCLAYFDQKRTSHTQNEPFSYFYVNQLFIADATMQCAETLTVYRHSSVSVVTTAWF